MDSYKKKVYCEFEFLKKFRDSGPNNTSFEALECWMDIRKFIQKSILTIDVDEKVFEEYIQSSNQILNLRKKLTQGECKCLEQHGFKYVENIISDERKRVDSAYLIDKVDAICKSYASKYGVVAISPKCWSSDDESKKVYHLFKNCGRPIDEGEVVKWSDMFCPEYGLSNCNSMVIIDNYIFNKGLHNLKQILDAILPQPIPGFQRSDKFHLTIVTAKDKYNPNKNYRNTYNEVVNMVETLRPKYCNVDLFIEQKSSSNTFHDRYILTNNAYIKIGGGFDLLDKSGKATKKTDISILYPGIQNFDRGCDEDYMSVINRVCYKVVNCANKGQWQHYPEDKACQNRLITL